MDDENGEGEEDEDEEYPELPPLVDPEAIPPKARLIFSTARFARGANAPVRLIAG